MQQGFSRGVNTRARLAQRSPAALQRPTLWHTACGGMSLMILMICMRGLQGPRTAGSAAKGFQAAGCRVHGPRDPARLLHVGATEAAAQRACSCHANLRPQAGVRG